MATNFNVSGAERKELVKAIENATGEKAQYKGMPTCAYQIGNLLVTKDGTLEGDAGAELLEKLAEAGFTGEPQEAPEAATEPDTEPETETVDLTVSIPTAKHTGASLRNLVNLLFTRSGLINKALGTEFRVDEELTKALQDDACTLTTDAFLKAVVAFEEEHGKAIDGLAITPETVTFSSLPETDDPERIRTFTILCSLMSKQAIDLKRIMAKPVNEENEKYALRIWLTRLGMNGPEYKAERKILMADLTGHCAFRTPAEEEKWKKRQAEKREALKAAKAALAAEVEEAADEEVAEA